MNDLDALLNALTEDSAPVADTTPAAATDAVSDDDLAALIEADATAVEASEAAPASEAAADATAGELTDELAGLLDELTGGAAETADAPVAAENGKKKGKKKGAVMIEAENADAEGVEKPAAEKKERQARIFFAKKTDRIQHKLGDKVAEYTLRELPDGDLTDEVIEAEKNATLAEIDKLGVKPQQRATLIIEYLAGKSNNLNSVIADAFKLLHTEGKVEMGQDGNLWKALSARYSTGSARAMGGNTLIAMKALKVIDEAGRANPKSLIYPAVIERMGLVEGQMDKAA